jgi:phosphate-selective porin OprO and OprP
MKRLLIFLMLFSILTIKVFGQNPNDILNLLINNKTITQEQADSIRAEAAIKQQETDANRKSFFVNAVKQIQISGYTQIRYQILDEKGKIDGFDIRRARLDIKGSISPYFAYRLQTDFALSPKLLDANADIKLADYFNITVGQFKIPFSLENLTSSNKLEAIDRSQAVEALVYRSKDVIGNHNGRDIGMQTGGSFLKIKNKSLIDYRLGLFNGNGINRSDSITESKTVVGRLVFHPVKGLDIGGSYLNGHEYFDPDPKKNQPLQRDNYDMIRFGTELSYEYKNISLRSEFLSGKDGTISRQGYYIQAGYYIIPQKLQFIAKLDSYDKNMDKAGDVSTYYIGALNFNFNPVTRLQVGYTIKKEESNEISNNLAVFQFQIGF